MQKSRFGQGIGSSPELNENISLRAEFLKAGEYLVSELRKHTDDQNAIQKVCDSFKGFAFFYD